MTVDVLADGCARSSIANTDGPLSPQIKLEDCDNDILHVPEAREENRMTCLRTPKIENHDPLMTWGSEDDLEACEESERESELDDYVPEHDSSGGRGDRSPTPPLSSKDTVKRIHWPRQHPGTPPPTPRKRKYGIPSPRRKPRPPVRFPNLQRRDSPPKRPQSGRKRRHSGLPQSVDPSPKKPCLDETDDNFWRPTTPPNRPEGSRKIIPLTPASIGKGSGNAKKKSSEINFLFCFVDDSLGSSFESFQKHLSSKTFFERAARAVANSSQGRQGSITIWGLVADIAGGTRTDSRIFLEWGSKNDYLLLRNAIDRAMRRAGKDRVDVKIFCLRKGEADMPHLPLYKS